MTEASDPAARHPWWKTRAGVLGLAAALVVAVVVATVVYVSTRPPEEPNWAGLDACQQAAADELGVDVDDVEVFIDDGPPDEKQTSFSPTLYVDGQRYSMLCVVEQAAGGDEWVVADYDLTAT